MLKDGWKSVSRVFILAVVLDVVYQLYVLHFVYPLQAIAVAIILAIVPYLILRGMVTRLAVDVARRGHKKPTSSPHTPPGDAPHVSSRRA